MPKTRTLNKIGVIVLHGLSKNEFLEKLTEKQIGCGVHYLSLAEHPYYQQRFLWKKENDPNALKIGQQTLSLPLSSSLSLVEQDRIILAVKTILEG